MSRYNPERRVWRGRSHKKGGRIVRHVRDDAGRAADLSTDRAETARPIAVEPQEMEDEG